MLRMATYPAECHCVRLPTDPSQTNSDDTLAQHAREPSKTPACGRPSNRSTPAPPPAKCFHDMLGVLAEFETNLRRERQLEGIAKGRPPASTRAARPR